MHKIAPSRQYFWEPDKSCNFHPSLTKFGMNVEKVKMKVKFINGPNRPGHFGIRGVQILEQNWEFPLLTQKTANAIELVPLKTNLKLFFKNSNSFKGKSSKKGSWTKVYKGYTGL